MQKCLASGPTRSPADAARGQGLVARVQESQAPALQRWTFSVRGPLQAAVFALRQSADARCACWSHGGARASCASPCKWSRAFWKPRTRARRCRASACGGDGWRWTMPAPVCRSRSTMWTWLAACSAGTRSSAMTACRFADPARREGTAAPAALGLVLRIHAAVQHGWRRRWQYPRAAYLSIASSHDDLERRIRAWDAADRCRRMPVP